MMRAAYLGPVALVGLLACPAHAQTGDAMLDKFANGGTPDGAIAFTFAIEDCVGQATTTQIYPAGATRILSATFKLTDLRTTSEEMLDFDGMDLAQINFLLKDEIATVDTGVILRSDDADVRAKWATQGAVCDGTDCTSVVPLDRVAVPIAGPNANERAEIALKKIRDMAAACATNE